LKRYELIGYQKPNPEAQLPTNEMPGASPNWFIIRPWCPTDNKLNNTNEWLLDTASPATNLGRRFNDTYSAVYGNYAFFRGSMRFRICWDSVVGDNGGFFNLASQAFSVYLVYPQPKKPAIDITWPRAEEHLVLDSTQMEFNNFSPHPAFGQYFDTNSIGQSPGPPLIPVRLAPSREEMGWEAISFINLEGGIEFEVPYYSTGHMSTAMYHTFQGDFWQSQRDGQYPLPMVVFGCRELPTTTFRVYRAVGDDFSFAGLLGVPRSTKVLEAGPQGTATAPDNLYTNF
jgi:hypothetical protein